MVDREKLEEIKQELMPKIEGDEYMYKCMIPLYGLESLLVDSPASTGYRTGF